MARGSGLLLHISSLPGSYGIGTFGSAAYDFADFLKKAKQKYWQLLPLCPTSFGDSPYQSPSAFALNPFFIDPGLLAEEGLLDAEELNNAISPVAGNISTATRIFTLVDYNKVYETNNVFLQKAYNKGKKRLASELLNFTDLHKDWLEDYALFMALKLHFGQREWQFWPEDIKKRTPEAMSWVKQELIDEIQYFQFIQYIAYKQWNSLKSYINQQGIQIIGDMPIYAASDSADTWSNAPTGIFKLDRDLTPLCVAGCPPDYFSEKGQYWGNTIYDWEKNKNTGYSWWFARMRSALSIYDWVRIDHFRGLHSYWEVPYGAENAVSGSWQPGPGIDFIQKLKTTFGDNLKIIAEDLGFMTDDVREFVNKSGFPGMKVLQFAFDSGADNEHLPHNYQANTIVYTGTHDNDTVLGWLLTADEHTRLFANRYFKLTPEEGYHWGMIRGAFSSVANLAIIPVQDLLGLDSGARMNIPSTIGGHNWRWRLTKDALTDELAEKLAALTSLYGRD